MTQAATTLAAPMESQRPARFKPDSIVVPLDSFMIFAPFCVGIVRIGLEPRIGRPHRAERRLLPEGLCGIHYGSRSRAIRHAEIATRAVRASRGCRSPGRVAQLAEGGVV